MRELKKKHKPGQGNDQLFRKAEDQPRDFFGVQAKLEMGQPGDQYEKEADAVADQVVSKTSAPEAIQSKGAGEEEVQQKPLAESISMVQKQDVEEEPVQSKGEEEMEEPVQKATEEEEEPVQKQEEEEEPVQTQEEEEEVQAKPAASMPKQQSANAIEAPLNHSKGSGKKMDQFIRNEMERGFGADFSQVKIHTDARANEMSKEIGAQAFTYGNDIYFNAGKFQPDSQKGKHLLAHELTHTIQQKGMVQKKLQGNWSKSESYKSFDGKVFRIDLNLKFTGAVLNKSSNTAINMAGLAASAKSQIEHSYKGKIAKSFYGMKLIYDVKTTANVRVINKLTDLNFGKEHLIVVLDNSHPKVKDIYGRGPFYGSIVYLNEKYITGMISGADKNTIPHEVGHTAGLKHLLEKKDESSWIGNLIKDIHHHANKDNIMWRGGGHPSYSMADADQKLTQTNSGQLEKLQKNLNKDKLNELNLIDLLDIALK